MKKRYVALLLLSACLLLRGQIYRLCVRYEPTGKRSFISLDEMDEISRSAAGWAISNPAADARDIIAFARLKTVQHASFTTRKVSGDPGVVMGTGVANCVGYSRLFAAILVHADKDNRLEQELLIGKLSLFGQSLHELTDNPFWSDHDYNKVTDVETGEVFFLDPTLYDYTRIGWVR